MTLANSVGRLLALATLILVNLLTCDRSAKAQEKYELNAIARDITTAPTVGGASGDVELSPDGRWVVYSVRQSSLESNERTTSYFVKDTDTGRPLALPVGVTSPRWSPDGKMLAFAFEQGRMSGSLEIDGFQNGRLIKIFSIDITGRIGTPNAWNFKWSPNSSHIAFLVLDRNLPQTVWRGVSAGISGDKWYDRNVEQYHLAILDVAHRLLRLPNISQDIYGGYESGFDWSPDSRKLALTIDRRSGASGFDSKIVVFSLANGQLETIVDRPGRNIEPLWSPDGKKILFASNDSHDAYRFNVTPAVCDIASGKIQYIHGVESGVPLRWSKDGKNFLWEVRWNFTNVVIRVDTQTLEPTRLPSSMVLLRHEENLSFDNAGDLVAFASGAINRPSDLFVSKAENGEPTGIPKSLTHFGDRYPAFAGLSVRELNWPSKDGRFELHGILLTPRTVTSRNPILVYLMGGPDMVSSGFDELGGVDIPLAAVALGYVVLIPNTRGRGGFGENFANAMEDEHSYAKLPLQDVLDGLARLRKLKIGDMTKVAIAGHSYGGYLTEYAITQTDLFGAAVVQEAHFADLSVMAYDPMFDGRYEQILAQDIYGFRNPLAPSEWRRLVEESPGFNAQRVRTPTLLLFGAQGRATEVGEKLYEQYKHLHVPTNLVVYEEPHVFQKPRDILDSIARAMNWINRWLRVAK